MSSLPPELVARAEVLRELSRDGGPLSPGAATATINNPAWFQSAPDGRVRPTEQRQALHDRLVTEYYQRHGRGQDGGLAIMLAEPPGAGKGSIRDQVMAETGQAFTIVDPDEFKTMLVRAAIEEGWIRDLVPVEAAERGIELAPMELAALVHEESSFLAARARRDAIANGKNILIDGVMANQDKAALHERGCSRGLNPPVLSRLLAV